jgi:hypothetical protein
MSGQVECFICKDVIEGEPAVAVRGWSDPDDDTDEGALFHWYACGKEECVTDLLLQLQYATPQMDWDNATAKATIMPKNGT